MPTILSPNSSTFVPGKEKSFLLPTTLIIKKRTATAVGCSHSPLDCRDPTGGGCINLILWKIRFMIFGGCTPRRQRITTVIAHVSGYGVRRMSSAAGGLFISWKRNPPQARLTPLIPISTSSAPIRSPNGSHLRKQAVCWRNVCLWRWRLIARRVPTALLRAPRRKRTVCKYITTCKTEKGGDYLGLLSGLIRDYSEMPPITCLQTIENKKIMKTEKSQEKANWLKARQQAARSGITLTRRKNSKGEYVCYMNKKSLLPGIFGL